MKSLLSGLVFLLSFYGLGAQPVPLAPGFDAAEYSDVLDLAFVYIGDSAGANNTFTLKKGGYQRLMRTPDVGLLNRAEIYLRSDSVAVINLRGTVNRPESWLENFYAAMIPANGSLTLNDSTVFNYKLSNIENAYVHAGWTLGLAHLAPYIIPELEVLLKRGITQVVVCGHSQGGALAFLTTSFLYYYFSQLYPALRFKTYCSAAPKPGNLYYGYDFDHITMGGYGLRVVNDADWVPECPFTVQTVADMNAVNPVKNAKLAIRDQKLMARVAIGYVFKQLDNSSKSTMRRYRKYLGQKLDNQVAKTLPQYIAPVYAKSSYYVPAGMPVILVADSAYHHNFPFDGKNVFVHHMHEPYKYLLAQWYGAK